MFADVAAATAVVLCLGVGVTLLADLYLIAVHLRRRGRAIADERASLHGLASVKERDSVCVQLTVFNESRSVSSAVDALCALDWPSTRLEIMVLDDSTDETSGIAAANIAAWRRRGVNVRHLQRTSRDGYKAGALAFGFEQTSAEFIAVFDVDYRPPRDFLAKCMSALAKAPRAAFVQARLDYRNRDSNTLTRAQAMQLDIYYAFEQAGRHWAGIPTPFNGTCGVWRRTAISDAGGWKSNSVTEDLDLSFRAFARGWDSLNLVTIVVEGELPESSEALASQRRRWSAGTSGTIYALPWNVLRHLRWDRAAIFGMLCLNHALQTIALPVILMAAISSWIVDPTAGAIALTALAVVLALIVGLKSAGAVLACIVTGRGIRRDFPGNILRMWVMEACLIPSRSKAQLEGLMRRQLPFMRTFKKG